MKHDGKGIYGMDGGVEQRAGQDGCIAGGEGWGHEWTDAEVVRW